MLIKLGEIIKDAREYKEITRAELAEYAGVSEEKVEETEENLTIPDFNGVRFSSTPPHTYA